MAKDIDLYQISAPHFTAGVEVERGFNSPVVSGACLLAPIVKYMRGWNLDEVERYCYAKGWTLTRAR